MSAKLTVNDFYAFKVGAMWQYFKGEHFAFKMICGYLFFEFTRLQSIFPSIDILPWPRLCLIGAIIGAFVDPSVRWTRSPANKWMALFLIGVICATATATYRDVAWKHFMDFFMWFVIYFLIINIVNTKERLYIFLMIFLIAAAKIAFGTSKSWAGRGFSFAAEGLLGPKGPFQNSGELSILMLTLFPLPLLMVRALGSAIKRWEKVLLTLFWIMPIMTITGASSRGAQVALACQLLILFRKSAFKIKPLVVSSIVVLGLVTLMPQKQLDRFSESGEDKTSQQRLLYWKRGREMIADHPVFGVGFYNFAPQFESRYSADALYGKAQLPHNILIQVGTDGGIPLMIYLLALITFCFTTAIKIARNTATDPLWRSVAAALGYGVLGFFIAGQFVTVTYYPFLWIHLAMLAAARNILLGEPATTPPQKQAIAPPR